MLKIEGLNLFFHAQRESKQILHDLHFAVQPGEVVALVGASGSGKTLTAQAILGLLPHSAFLDPNSNISFMGQDLTKLNETNLCAIRGKHIGMIFQEPLNALNPVKTIGQQIDETLRLHTNYDKKQRKQYILELLQQVGISDAAIRYKNYPHQLSGGMRQRIMIAMAIACHPSLIIADEPTTALDVTIQMQIIHLLKQLQQKLNISILLITHDLGIVRQIAQRVVVLQQGHIVENSTADEFFATPKHSYSQSLLQAAPKITIFPAKNFNHDKNNLMTVKDMNIHYSMGSWWQRRSIHAIKAIDLNLKQGESLAIVGESGCGKTSLAKALMQLIPYHGEIYLHEQLAQNDIKQYRRHVQMIFQDAASSLNPRWLVNDLLAEGIKNFDKSLSKKQITDQIEKILAQLGFEQEALWRYPHEFSGGQRSRLNIARALLLHPKILICDEPTSSLDTIVQAQILKLLLELKTTLQLSYILITHSIAVVSQMADTVAVMYLGRIVEMGTVEEVLTRAKHPYTQMLLQSVATIDTKKPELKQQAFELPSMVNPTLGCPFHTRCEFAKSECQQIFPQKSYFSNSHFTFCHLYSKRMSFRLGAKP